MIGGLTGWEVDEHETKCREEVIDEEVRWRPRVEVEAEERWRLGRSRSWSAGCYVAMRRNTSYAKEYFAEMEKAEQREGGG